MQRFSFLLSGFFAGIFFLAASPASAAPRYRLVVLRPTGDAVLGAVSNVGGYALNFPKGHGKRGHLAVVSGHQLVNYDSDRKAHENEALGLNDAGVAVGRGHGEARVFANGESQSLLSMLVTNSTWTVMREAGAINNAGQIAGIGTSLLNGRSRAFLFTNGMAADIGTIANGDWRTGSWGDVAALNESGQVVGSVWVYIGGFVTHAAFFDGVAVRDLGTLGGYFSNAYDVNDRGQIVGKSSIRGGLENQRAFLFENGVMRNLGSIHGAPSRAFAINNAGTIVGSVGQVAHAHAMVYQRGRMYDLNKVVLNRGRWTIESAAAINEAGVVTATGRLPDGSRAVLRLKPMR